jgi:SAM-dependent methyltransferase
LLDTRLRGVRIFGFDHSVESLAVLHNTATATGCAQDVELSTQDIGCLAFAPDSFDVIIGNAVLHHFLDVAGTVARLVALLRPVGRAVFAEPFLYGHLLVMALLRMAADDTAATAGAPGPLEQITENVVYRARYGTNLPALADLTDKHLFVEEDIVRLGASLNCTVRFANVEPEEYYAAFMNDVVRTWDPGAEAARRARELYRQVWNYLGDVIPRRFAHYRFMIIERA